MLFKTQIIEEGLFSPKYDKKKFKTTCEKITDDIAKHADSKNKEIRVKYNSMMNAFSMTFPTGFTLAHPIQTSKDLKNTAQSFNKGVLNTRSYTVTNYSSSGAVSTIEYYCCIIEKDNILIDLKFSNYNNGSFTYIMSKDDKDRPYTYDQVKQLASKVRCKIKCSKDKISISDLPIGASSTVKNYLPSIFKGDNVKISGSLSSDIVIKFKSSTNESCFDDLESNTEISNSINNFKKCNNILESLDTVFNTDDISTLPVYKYNESYIVDLETLSHVVKSNHVSIEEAVELIKEANDIESSICCLLDKEMSLEEFCNIYDELSEAGITAIISDK